MLQCIAENKIKVVDLSSFLTEFNTNQLNQLIETNLKFKNLDINFSPLVSWYQLHLLLKLSSNTLENLKLFHGLGSGIPFEFPYEIRLTNLSTLELVCDMVESFDFLHLTPKLKSLVILQHGDMEEAGFSHLIQNTSQEFKPHLNLTCLSMEHILTPECVSRLGRQIAPNLSKLSAHLNDDSLPSVFTDLIHLEELSILGTEVTDEGLTGIPMSALLGEHTNMAAYREFPYIGNCTRKCFNFTCFSLCL